MTVALILGLMLSISTLVARGSGRRLALAGSIGLLITFLALPLFETLGARSDQTILPTALALASTYPLLWITPLFAALTAFAFRKTPIVVGAMAAITGLTALGSILVIQNGPEHWISLQAVGGVLETVFPLGLLIVLIPIVLGQKNETRIVFGVIGILLSLGFGVFLYSNQGATVFPNLRNYYKITTQASDAQLKQAVVDWNADLKQTNEDRKTLQKGWETTLKNLETASGTDLARERRSYALLVGEIRDYRIVDPTHIDLLSTVTSASEIPLGYRPGYDASEMGLRRIMVQHGQYGYALWLFFGILSLSGGLTFAIRGKKSMEDTDVSLGFALSMTAIVIGAAVHSVQFDLQNLIVNFPWITDFLSRAFPPNPKFIAEVSREMLITLNTALLGTVLAATFAVPISLLAARNLTERSPVTRVLYVITRIFFNINRGVDTLIVALVFVAALGLGPFAGVLAMALHSIADLGKLYSEAMENADKGPIEALESAGAPGSSVVRWALFPQLLPLMLSYTLYRFEINFRVSIVLGFVGAGGIGFLVTQTMRGGQYPDAIVAIIAIVIVVNILDFISASVRKRLV